MSIALLCHVRCHVLHVCGAEPATADQQYCY